MPGGFSTIILDYTGVYQEESFFPDDAIRADFTSLEGTECFCDADSAAYIRKAIASMPAGALHWIDTGDYHYSSLFWLEKVKEPFVLVLIDMHPDDQPSALAGDMLSCGSWVKDAARTLSMMKERIWVNGSSMVPDIPDLPVYLSIDLDVLCRCCARTNWDQGNMMTDQLKALVRHIALSHKVIGVDVCGGITISKGASGFDLQINRELREELQLFLVNLPNQD